MSKILLTTMNGVLSFDPNRSTVLSAMVDEQRAALVPKSVTCLHEIRKGGPDTGSENDLLRFLLRNYAPGDVWVAFGFSYGGYDTTKLIKRFNRDYHGDPRYPMIIAGLLDIDWPGNVVNRILGPTRKIVGPVSAGINLYQKEQEFPGGTSVKWRIRSTQAWYSTPPEKRAIDREIHGYGHAAFDTCPAARDAVGWCLGYAVGEVIERNKRKA